MPSKDTINFVNAAKCRDAANEIANKLVMYSGPPTEDEILSRCRYMFEYILHKTAEMSCLPESQLEIEVQHEEKE